MKKHITQQSKADLVGGGPNPLENYLSRLESSPSKGEKKKYLSCHHLEIYLVELSSHAEKLLKTTKTNPNKGSQNNFKDTLPTTNPSNVCKEKFPNKLSFEPKGPTPPMPPPQEIRV